MSEWAMRVIILIKYVIGLRSVRVRECEKQAERKGVTELSSVESAKEEGMTE